MILYDKGLARSRGVQRVTYILAERGTCFALWQDRIDNLSDYRITGPAFHTMCLSTGKHFCIQFYREMNVRFTQISFSLFYLLILHRSQQNHWLQFRFERGGLWYLVMHWALNQWPRKYIVECAGTKATETNEKTKTIAIAAKVTNLATMSICSRHMRYDCRFSTLF